MNHVSPLVAFLCLKQPMSRTDLAFASGFRHNCSKIETVAKM